jgi:hypothetical protein
MADNLEQKHVIDNSAPAPILVLQAKYKEAKKNIEQTTSANEADLLAETALSKINKKPKSIDLPKFKKLENGKKITSTNLKEAVQGLLDGDLSKIGSKIGKLISIFYDLFTGKANNVQGIGLELINKAINNPSKAQIISHLKEVNQSSTDWKNKIGVSSALFSHEASLHRAGYRPKKAKTSLAISVNAGQKIKDLLRPEVWDQIQNGNVLNALDYENELPISGHLHLDEKGFPIYFSDKRNENHEVLLFEKETNEEKLADMQNDSNLEILESKLEPGDIIWTYNENSQFAAQLIRAGQDPDFPFAHMMVYLGNGQVGQIHLNGGERFSLAEMIGPKRNYKNICVGEIANDDKPLFVAEVNDWIDKTKDYAESVYLDTAASVFRNEANSRQRHIEKGESAVCTDLLRASQNKDIQKLLNEKGESKPYEFFKHSAFRAKYSVAKLGE